MLVICIKDLKFWHSLLLLLACTLMAYLNIFYEYNGVSCISSDVPDGCVPDRKFLDVASLGQSVPRLFCPWTNHPIPKFRFFNSCLNIILGCLYGCDWHYDGLGRVSFVGTQYGQADSCSGSCFMRSVHGAVQGRDTSVRGIISKGRFVQGAQHPRTFGRGHIGRGHINPASSPHHIPL